jgi:hypothetical protein
VMTCAERCRDLCGYEMTEILPARDSAKPRGRSNNRRVDLSRWASAQVCEVIDPQTASDFAKALSFHHEVPAQQPAVAQFFQARLPAIHGAAWQFKCHRLGCARAIVMGVSPQLDREAFAKLAWCVDIAIRVHVLASLMPYGVATRGRSG